MILLDTSEKILGVLSFELVLASLSIDEGQLCLIF